MQGIFSHHIRLLKAPTSGADPVASQGGISLASIYVLLFPPGMIIHLKTTALFLFLPMSLKSSYYNALAPIEVVNPKSAIIAETCEKNLYNVAN